MGVGMAGAALSAVLLVALPVYGGLPVIVAASLVMSLSLGPVVTLATELIVGSAPPEKAGAATGISETSAELGGALGIAFLGSLGTVVYRTDLGRTLPGGVPPQAADAARDTLGGAVAVSAELPPQIGVALLEAARASFVDGIHVVAALTAALALVVAIVAARVLRSVPKRAEPAETAVAQGTAPA
jgi:DHA2 family multidrug resistance protein-like MFS transporter